MSFPYDAMLPAIRQMHEAEDDRARARILLSAPDRVLMQYRDAFEDACRRAGFDLGLQFMDIRRAEWHAVRGADGRHKNPLFEDVRREFAIFAGVAS